MATGRQCVRPGRCRDASRRAAWAVGALCAGFCAACQPPAEMPPDLTPTAGTLTLGTIDVPRFGDTRWVDLADDQMVQLVPGAQGGFHVWVLYRTQGISGRVQVFRIAERLPPDGSPRQRVLTTSGFITIPTAELWQTPDPIPSFMCPTPIGVSVLSAPIEISVRITAADDANLTLAQAKVRLQEQCPPDTDPTHAFCLRICQG